MLLRIIDVIRQAFIVVISAFARSLNRVTGGRINPNAVTLTSLLAHVPIAWLIAFDHWIPAAVILFVFGLLDKLDGELARLQKRESPNGALLDSVTDRMKEVLLYIGIVYYFAANSSDPWLMAVVALALGCSVLTSYLNAMGDAIMARKKAVQHSANKAFRGGYFPFEVRMAALFVGLLTGYLEVMVIVIAVGALYTACERMVRVYGVLARG